MVSSSELERERTDRTGRAERNPAMEMRVFLNLSTFSLKCETTYSPVHTNLFIYQLPGIFSGWVAWHYRRRHPERTSPAYGARPPRYRVELWVAAMGTASTERRLIGEEEESGGKRSQRVSVAVSRESPGWYRVRFRTGRACGPLTAARESPSVLAIAPPWAPPATAPHRRSCARQLSLHAPPTVEHVMRVNGEGQTGPPGVRAGRRLHRREH